MTVQIKLLPPDPSGTVRALAKVTTRKGYVYACTYADSDTYTAETLTVEQVTADWKSDRRSFLPYDETRGVYLV